MGNSTLAGRLAVGLIGTAATAALVIPTAAGAAPSGSVAAAVVHAAPIVTPASAPAPAPDRLMVVVHLAPVGTAGPAAPAPRVVALNRAAAAQPGRHEVKQGYVDVQQAAWAGVGPGALQGAGIGALVGAIAGGIIGIFVPVPIISIIPGAISGALTGAVWGAVWGGVTGYLNAQSQAEAHNNAVRKNGGKPVAATVAPPVHAPTRVTPTPVYAPSEIPDIKLPPQAHRMIDDAKLAFARAFGIPTPK